nr:hypothetical protein [Nostoc sp. ChiSLP03a]MDZ8215791.1 hypothetical protein [Nostoc sp. ChiSLP03a]
MSNAYIIKSYRSPESIKLYLDTLLEGYSKADYHFFVHVLCGTLISYAKEEDGWVPVSSELIRKTWGKTGVQFTRMIEEGMLEIKILDEFQLSDGTTLSQTYSKNLGLSREFRVSPQVFDMVMECSPNTPEEFANCKYYNLCDGRLMNKQIRYPKNNSSNNYYPQLILDAMETLQTCKVNVKALREHIAKLTADATDPVFGGGDKAKRALVIDRSAYNHIMSNIVKLEGDLADYQLIFSEQGPQMSGRISEAHSGMQSCSRKMKEAGFSDIPDLRNYDLKSSQVYGLIQWFEMANIDTSWLHNYLAQDKQVFANKVGISKDRWKECFMAIVMGAHLQKKVERKHFESVKVNRFVKGEAVVIEESPEEAIFKALYEESNGNPDVALEYFIKFNEVIAPLKAAIDKWQAWLLNEYVPANSVYPRGQQCVVNKTGMTFDLTPYLGTKGKWKNESELKRKLAAFYLQGVEAGYIHWITVLSKDFGYTCLSNQHDGLVTIGEIPEEAREIAKQRSGLKYAVLEEKAFN